MVLCPTRTTACHSCAIKNSCTKGKERLISRWEHEQIHQAVQRRLDEHPEKMRQRRETVEHPFGTIKARMGATHFLYEYGSKSFSVSDISRGDCDSNFKPVALSGRFTPLREKPYAQKVERGYTENSRARWNGESQRAFKPRNPRDVPRGLENSQPN